MKSKGFTLIELVILVAIVMILFAVTMGGIEDAKITNTGSQVTHSQAASNPSEAR